MANTKEATWAYYRYDPSLAAAIIFVILFLATTTLHLYQLIRTRTWYLVPLLVGGFFEWIGYSARAVSSNQTPNWTLGPYLVQSLLPLVAPALFAASIYMELGRIILMTDGETHSLIRRKWLTKIFVCGDVLSFMTQASGGGIMAGKSASSMRNGANIVVVGLILQILFFGFFMVTALIFHLRIVRVPTSRIFSGNIPWTRHMNVLYATSALIMVRSIFRTIEYVQGDDGYFMRHEWYLYVFDATLMLGVLVSLNLVHPSQVNAYLKGGKYSTGALKLRTLRERI